jgi:RimJ/RimL family protein N-acetyltransferase
MVASAFQRRGIAFEVGSMCLDYGFNTLNLNRMVGNCLPGNAAIVRLMKKLGFVEEGVMRQHFFHQGCFKDAISWGILREDFNGKRKGDLSLNAGSRGPETTL